MKFFSRFFITLGVLLIGYSIIQLIFEYTSNTWESWMEFGTYFILESPERFVLIVGLVLLIVGRAMFKKVRSRGRIFY